MNIVIVTQNAPMYLSSFLDGFFVLLFKTNHFIKSIVVTSPLFGNTLLQEIKERYSYYGFIDFLKMVFLITRNKLLSFVFYIYPAIGCYSIDNVIDKYQIKKHKTKSVNSKEFIDYIKKNQIDLIISVASSQIFKKDLLVAPKKGCINYHTGLLPKYRGRQPLFWALLNGENKVGISIHEMDEKIDNGPIIAQKKMRVNSIDALHSLYLKTIKIGPELLLEAISKIDDNFPDRIKNDSKKATCYGLPTKKDAKIFKSKKAKFF